jgi:hypothetical protein
MMAKKWYEFTLRVLSEESKDDIVNLVTENLDASEHFPDSYISGDVKELSSKFGKYKLKKVT